MSHCIEVTLLRLQAMWVSNSAAFLQGVYLSICCSVYELFACLGADVLQGRSARVSEHLQQVRPRMCQWIQS